MTAALRLLLYTVLTLGSTAGAAEVALYGYEVLERRAHPRENFVQGLEIRGDTLWISIGGYGSSALREYDFASMQLRRQQVLPETLFGEGVTVLDERIYQLTWRAGIGLVYDRESLQPLRQWSLGTQGWGLTNDGESLIYSDGSNRLYLVHPESLQTERVLEVTLRGNPLPRLNELEWIDGEIWANVWGANQLVTIDPASGEVTRIIDLRGLLPDEDRRGDTDVLNGIAVDRRDGAIWVTGKRWPWLYRIALQPRNQQPAISADKSR